MDKNILPIVGFSKWDADFWTVVIKRPLAGVGPNMVSFTSGTYPIAYAQWDAFYREVNGRKYVTDDWADNLIIP
jgi:DMSO reductase family type II enzyme heme b subunit